MDIASYIDRILGRQDAEIRKYMREVERNLGGLKRRDKKQMLNEIRAHIDEKFEEMVANSPGKDRAVVAHSVLEEFGEPVQVAKSYVPEGFIPRRESTAVKIVKIFATMIVLIVAIPMVFGCLFFAIGSTEGGSEFLSSSGAYTREFYERPYYYVSQCVDPKTTIMPESETFSIKQNTTSIKFTLVVSSASGVPGISCVRIQIKNSQGETVYDDNLYGDGTEIKVTNCEAVPGQWSISYTYIAFSGTVVVDSIATIVESYCI